MDKLKLIVLGAAVAVLAFAAVLVPGSGDASRRDEAVLRVASQKGGAKALLLSSGALDGAPYRVEWSEFPAAQPLLEALAAGAVDIGATGDSPFIFAYASGAKIKAIQASRSAGGGSATAVIVRNDSPLKTAADLKGRRIATGRGSIGHYLLLRLLEREHIALSEVTIVYLSQGDSKAAFSTGDIDAWATWNPYVGAAVLHDGARILADGQGVLTGIGFQVASEAAIATKRPELADFLSRLRRASAWATEHRDAYAEVLAQETGLPPDVAAYTVARGLALPVALDESVLQEERETLETFVRAGLIEAAPDIGRAFDPSFGAALTASNQGR